MSNFHSNYKDIHKQIAIADFTDEQIQELITALQIKRSAKSKLTKEEKVFYQCCRERRSYAQNQDLDTVVCPHCGSSSTEKEIADRDISARIVKRHLEIPTAQLPFAPKCLLANGLSLSS